MPKKPPETAIVKMSTGAFHAEIGLLEPNRVYELPFKLAETFVNDKAAEWADNRMVPENAPLVDAPRPPLQTAGAGQV